jgi:cytochrome b6-f complex iron-sulfur subunit
MVEPERADLRVRTPVAGAAPRRRLLTRRVFVLGGFWSGLALAVVGALGGPLRFVWPPALGAFGRSYTVRPEEVPLPGTDPVRFPIGRFYLVHLEEGQEGSRGGVLAVYQKCTHLGCTVPWRPDFEFQTRKGWYRCPCHGSTFTRGAAILVAGPAPRPLDTMAVEVEDDGTVIVHTGEVTLGGADNPERAVPYGRDRAADSEGGAYA